MHVWPARSQGLSKRFLARLQERATSYDTLAAYNGLDARLVRDGRSEIATAWQVTADYLRVFRARAAVGRLLQREDERRGPRTAVISWGYWQRSFGGDPGIVGEVFDIEGEPTTIVGVLEGGFEAPQGPFDLLVSHVVEADDIDFTGNYLDIVGRLAPGATPELATAELRTIAIELAD